MPHALPHGRIAHEGGRVLDLRDRLPAPSPRVPGLAGTVRVTVVGDDVQARLRLMELLDHTPDVRVVGWADSVQAVAMLGLSAEVCLAVEPETAGGPDTDRSDPAPRAGGPMAPGLSSRQREVLAAYASGNELLYVVARRLGMGAETLKTHLRRIRAKYEAAGRPAPTRRDLFVRAVEDGLLPPPQ